VAQSPALAQARRLWGQHGDFVWQVHRQLNTRSKLDYMSSEPEHLSGVLAETAGVPRHIGLFMTEAEAAEFERRIELGDVIPEIDSLLGVKAPTEEGGDEISGPNYGGAWQDQLDGGRIVVALVDPTNVDVAALAQALGGEEHLKIVEAELSFDELIARRDAISQALIRAEVPTSLRIESRSDGKHIVVQAPDIRRAENVVRRADLATGVEFVEGQAMKDESSPSSTHSEADQMPGLRITTQGGLCTWGVNGHTASLNYATLAAHCFQYNLNYSGWASSTELEQGSGTQFLLTPGTQYLKTTTGSNYDSARMSTPQADSNCYHSNSDCARFIAKRTLHNSWEVNSDWVCLSMGNTNSWDCGVVQEEYWEHTCTAGQMVRYDIDTGGGDSGGGVIGLLGGTSASIDAIHTCADGTSGGGNTAYHVKQALGFDFNCSTVEVTNRAASAWGSCPTIDR